MKIENWRCLKCSDDTGNFHHALCPERNGGPILDGIIVDLDGTLADNTHRRKHIEGDEQHWGAYRNGIQNDNLNQWCENIIEGKRPFTAVFIVTGRMAESKTVKDTVEWLNEHDITYDELHMRPEGDYTPDHELKKDIYHNHIKHKIKSIDFVLDDRQSVVDMWRDEGLTCLQCADGDF